LGKAKSLEDYIGSDRTVVSAIGRVKEGDENQDNLANKRQEHDFNFSRRVYRREMCSDYRRNVVDIIREMNTRRKILSVEVCKIFRE
jgi:hypothetical protein